MAELSRILRESFRLLGNQPRLFVPKLFSAIISSLWVVGFFSGRLSITYTVALVPIISFLGVFASLMVAAMVRNREDKSLKKGFVDASKSWKVMVYTVLFFGLAGLMLSVPVGLGLYAYIYYGSIEILAATAVVSLVLLAVLTVATYFLPITLLENKSFKEGFKDSLETSRSRPGEVTMLTLLSFVLLLLAFASNDYLETLGYAGFILGRMVSAVVTTYIFVVSPRYYLAS